jgi:FkbM family methyltransferase
MRVTRYQLKRALLSPHTAYKRRQARDLDPFSRAILEAQYYRPTMYKFIAATAANPDLLVQADLDESSVVLDVGAYVGEWSEAISSRYGSKIYAFEPVPRAVAQFCARLGDDDNVEIHPYGLAAVDAHAPLALEGPGSTVRREGGTFGSAVVQLRDVAAVLDELGVDRIDLCKMNIEGGEYDVFDRLIATGWLPRIDVVSVQFHEWHPKAYARRRAIRRALRRTHDEVWGYPFVWELWRRRKGSHTPSPGRPATAPVQEA